MADVKVTERELEVLVKMLGMLGAATVGERAAAALKVSSWVKDRGLAWSDVILPPPPPPVTVRVRGEGDSWMNSMAQMAAQAQAREAAAQAMAQAAQARAQAQAQAQAWRAQAQPPSSSFTAAPQAAQGPPWQGPAGVMAAQHTNLLKGSKEAEFLNSQLARAQAYGTAVRLSVKQEAWLRDILGRAGLGW